MASGVGVDSQKKIKLSLILFDYAVEVSSFKARIKTKLILQVYRRIHALECTIVDIGLEKLRVFEFFFKQERMDDFAHINFVLFYTILELVRILCNWLLQQLRCLLRLCVGVLLWRKLWLVRIDGELFALIVFFFGFG